MQRFIYEFPFSSFSSDDSSVIHPSSLYWWLFPMTICYIMNDWIGTTAPQFVPQNVTCLPLDSKSLKIGWSIPKSLENLYIEGFYIGYKVFSSLDPFTYKTMHILLDPSSKHTSPPRPESSSRSSSVSRMASATAPLSSESFSSGSSSHPAASHSILLSSSSPPPPDQRKFEYVIDLLRKSTKYSVIIQAFNSKGAGPSSPEITAETYANGTWQSLEHLNDFLFLSCLLTASSSVTSSEIVSSPLFPLYAIRTNDLSKQKFKLSLCLISIVLL